MDVIWITWGIMIGVFGAMIGSFLNVCIWRIPLEQSIIFPSSHCPVCSHVIRFYDNIPVVSYLILRGRCRDCQERISPRYPLIEALTGFLAFILFGKYGFSLQLLCAFLFTASLIVVTFIDIDYQIIPDVITLPGIPLCFFAAVFVMEVSFWESLLGIIGGGGILYVFAIGYERLKKQEGMGGGDIKLLAMLGAFWGWKSLFFILLISSCVGALVGVFLILRFGRGMKYALPFGPFLALGAVSYFFLGEAFHQIFYLSP